MIASDKATDTEQILSKVPGYKETALSASRSIHTAILQGGNPLRSFADLLHGKWLGHPLHPALTDFVVGAWVFGSLLDFIGPKHSEKAADQLIELGTAAAIPTALAGLTDFSAIPGKAAASGATHGLLNVAALGLYALSIRNRRVGNRGTGVFLSSMALGMITVSAWLGGELVYRHRVGVNKIEQPSEPHEWTPVMNEADLAEQQPVRVDVQGAPVLLYRYGGTVYAISAICSHEGGPLEEGKFDGYCVECPWHQSVFDLRTGEVVHGPTTYPQPSYNSRINNGQVELRLPQSGASDQ